MTHVTEKYTNSRRSHLLKVAMCVFEHT